MIVPWTSWLQSGDTRIIEQNWDAMAKYLAAIEQSNPDYLWKTMPAFRLATGFRLKAQTKELLVRRRTGRMT